MFFEKNLIFYPNSSGKLAVWERNSPNVIYHRGWRVEIIGKLTGNFVFLCDELVLRYTL